MRGVVAAVDAVLVTIGTVAVYVAVVDAVDMWRTRPRPVRGLDGRWRAARRPSDGWGRR